MNFGVGLMKLATYKRCALLAVLGLISTSQVYAQEGSGSSMSAGGVLTIDAFVIQGNVEKPQVQYFISREKIRDVTPLDLKESFLDKIVQAVEKEPF